VLLNAAAVVVIAFSIFPVYWMVNTSLLPGSAIKSDTPHLWPDLFTVQNYVTALGSSGFGAALLTSVVVTVVTVAAALVFAFLAAIVLSRFRFRGRTAIIVTVLVVQMIPAESMIISTFRVLDGWHLVNTMIGLSLVYIALVLPFTIWTLRGFVAGIPADLEEAAMIDGCSRTGAFWRVTFPLLAPGLVATGVFAFIQAWNEFVFALVIMTRPESQTLPIWLRSFVQATKATDWSVVMAASTLMAIPVIVFFLIVQRRMAAGLVSGAVKG
jgi:N,N'-diacetylchitobiose transport system permease protein